MFEILKDFDRFRDFLTAASKKDMQSVYEIFDGVAAEIGEMGAEKLSLEGYFVRDIELYNRKNPQVIAYFTDIQKRYLFLSDLYDYLRITKKL